MPVLPVPYSQSLIEKFRKTTILFSMLLDQKKYVRLGFRFFYIKIKSNNLKIWNNPKPTSVGDKIVQYSALQYFFKRSKTLFEPVEILKFGGLTPSLYCAECTNIYYIFKCKIKRFYQNSVPGLLYIPYIRHWPTTHVSTFITG